MRGNCPDVFFMYNKKSIYILFPVLLFCLLCSCHSKATNNSSPKGLTKAVKKDTLHKDPVISEQREKILRYFDRHKNEDFFDTTDATYGDWWGMWGSSVNSAQAGHLFNDRQIHAIVYYLLDENKAAFFVYLRANGGWREIFQDSDFSQDLIMSFEDWNGDGIKDITLSYRMPVDHYRDRSYTVYLTDKSGTRLHEVKGFEDLRTPQIDTPSGQIITEDQYRESEYFGAYRFINYKLDTLMQLVIRENWYDTTDKNDCTIIFSKHDKAYREIKTSNDNILKYLPPPFRRRSLYNPANQKEE